METHLVALSGILPFLVVSCFVGLWYLFNHLINMMKEQRAGLQALTEIAKHLDRMASLQEAERKERLETQIAFEKERKERIEKMPAIFRVPAEKNVPEFKQ